MKRVIDGVTYNTDTSTELATVVLGDLGRDEDVWDRLYVTRGGAFFLHHHVDREVWVERAGQFCPNISDTFEPLSRDTAQKWMDKHGIEMKAVPVDDPSEATLYVRVPATLKRRVDEAAKTDGVSVNVWAMRCIETCLDRLN